MIRRIMLIVLVLSVILVGCQKAVKETPKEAAPSVSIDEDVSAADSLDKDIGTQDLDNIESDLDNISW